MNVSPCTLFKDILALRLYNPIDWSFEVSCLLSQKLILLAAKLCLQFVEYNGQGGIFVSFDEKVKNDKQKR